MRAGLRRLLGLAGPPTPGGGEAVGKPAPQRQPGEPGERREPGAGDLTRIRDCTEGPEGRPVVRVRGTLRAVSAHTVAGMPALRAELDDGSGSLGVIWLGRTAIAGIEPDRELTASGRLAVTHGHTVLFNPRYQLQPREQE